MNIPENHKRFIALSDFQKNRGDVRPLNDSKDMIPKRRGILKDLKEITNESEAYFFDSNLTEEGRKKTLFYTTIATVSYVLPNNLYYNACRGEKCFKKVIKDGDDKWRCQYCDGSWDEPLARFIGKIKIMDHTTYLFSRISNQKVGSVI